MVDSSGTIKNSYSYDPYGNSLNKNETVSNPWQYASGYYDATTSLYKFGTRYYDPQLGRWTQKDPIGGSVGRIGSGNPYVYAGNVPTMKVDPSGRSNCSSVSNADLDAIAWAWIIYGAEYEILGFVADATVLGLPAGFVFGVLGIIIALEGTFMLWYFDKYYPNGMTICF